ncbi:hypothetical protein RB195_007140 [Necator americanus]|uniref:Uncharacterized protein n=1 Tax=Necator americanus TaxID=51031 RepID=A0ABR1BXJ9_NECAM
MSKYSEEVPETLLTLIATDLQSVRAFEANAQLFTFPDQRCCSGVHLPCTSLQKPCPHQALEANIVGGMRAKLGSSESLKLSGSLRDL